MSNELDPPILRCEDPNLADLLIIGAGYDRTASFGKGAIDGPRAILDSFEQLELYDRVSDSIPCELLSIGKVEVADLNELSAQQMVERLTVVYESYSNAFRLLLGGEHSVTNAPLCAFADHADAITVVQIDAHADLREDDSDFEAQPHGRFAHCSVMRRALDLNYKICQIGVRAYSHRERALFDHPDVTTFEWSSSPASAETIIDSIKTECVYLTIDVDGLDPAVMPATGTPVPGGLDWYTTLQILERLTVRHRLVGADIVEVAPRAGDSQTQYNAAQLAYSLIGLLAREGSPTKLK